MATKMTREEAIKIVQSATVWTDEERDALAMLIPELAESEDEKIRKAIIGIIKNSNVFDINVSHERMFAYLEKQAEQKQEKFPPYVTGFKGDPDPAGASDLEEAAKEYASKTLCDPDDGPSTGLAKESFIAGAEWQKEQKSAEWSEEDEKDMADEAAEYYMKKARKHLFDDSPIGRADDAFKAGAEWMAKQMSKMTTNQVI